MCEGAHEECHVVYGVVVSEIPSIDVKEIGRKSRRTGHVSEWDPFSPRISSVNGYLQR